MYNELAMVLRETICPNCGVLGHLSIQEAQAYIQCTACNKTHIDPFEVGPWESRIIEKHEEQVVAAYHIDKVLPENDKEIDEAYAEFVKFLYPDAAKREIPLEVETVQSEGE